MILIVDDMPERLDFFRKFGEKVLEKDPNEIYTATHYWEAVRILEKWHGEIEILFLDHDLNDFGKEGGAEWTGHDLARTMVDRGWKIPKVIVHSINPVGAWNIEFFLTENGWEVEKIPYFKFLERWGEVRYDD